MKLREYIRLTQAEALARQRNQARKQMEEDLPKICDLLKDRSLRARELRMILGISQDSINRRINRLMDDGLIERDMNGNRWTLKYRLVEHGH